MKSIKKISLNDTTNRYLDLDTETIHSGIVENDNVKEIKDIIEISWKVLNCDGVEVLGTRKGFIVKEFWENEDYLLSSNYAMNKGQIVESQNFAINKIEYWKDQIDKGNLKVMSWGAILKQLSQDIKDYKVTLFSAYNAKFDRQAIVSTSQIIPYKNYCKGLWELDFLDIMLICEIFAKQKDFKKWADNHGAISQAGNYQCKAETIYRYLTNNNEKLQLNVPDSYCWAESHIALEDIDCEGVILQAAISLSRRKREIKVEINKYGSWQGFNKQIKLANTKKKKTSNVKQLELLTIGG
jgi:hypothetical protein